MNESSHVAPFRDGPVELMADGALRLHIDLRKYRIEGNGTNELRLHLRSSGPAAAPVTETT